MPDAPKRAPRAKILGGAALVFAAALVLLFARGRGGEGAPPKKEGGQTPVAITQGEAPAAKLTVTDIGIDAAATPAPSGTGTITLGWGGGDHDVGRLRPEEGNPEAPMSLVLDPKGNVLVLDQVNARMLRLGKDGKTLGIIPVPLRAAQDVAIAPDGTMAVLDRLGDKGIAILGPDGKLIGTLPLEGKGIDEAGGLTGVFVDGKSVYVEREHGTLVRVGDTSGVVDESRPELPGRPSRDGRLLLSAGITDGSAGRLFISAIERATEEHVFTRELRMGMPIVSIMLLDSDAAGVVYLATLAEIPSGDEPVPAVFLTCLSSGDGQPGHTVQLPVNASADETFREMTVAPAGGVVYAHRTESGMTLSRYDCR